MKTVWTKFLMGMIAVLVVVGAATPASAQRYHRRYHHRAYHHYHHPVHRHYGR